VAFARSGSAVTAVTRLSARLAEAGGWRDTVLTLPPGRWADVLAPERKFTGHARVADVFGESPVALLERVDESH
jgi:(1->4)-alpha-D-glucan 1-alpha-D-glucosylmutase